MTDKPIREQSALELLETHAQALEAENAGLTRQLEIQKQGQNAITNGLCAERDRMRAKLTLLQEGSPREALRQLKLVLADSSPSETPAEPDPCELAAELERTHVRQVLADVAAIAGDRTDTYWSAHAQACEEILHRLQTTWGDSCPHCATARGSAVETAGEPSEVWACVSKGISPPYVRFFESKAEMEAYEWRDDSVSPNRYRPAEKATGEHE